jgi:hypothetical protein
MLFFLDSDEYEWRDRNAVDTNWEMEYDGKEVPPECYRQPDLGGAKQSVSAKRRTTVLR